MISRLKNVAEFGSSQIDRHRPLFRDIVLIVLQKTPPCELLFQYCIFPSPFTGVETSLFCGVHRTMLSAGNGHPEGKSADMQTKKLRIWLTINMFETIILMKV